MLAKCDASFFRYDTTRVRQIKPRIAPARACRYLTPIFGAATDLARARVPG